MPSLTAICSLLIHCMQSYKIVSLWFCHGDEERESVFFPRLSHSGLTLQVAVRLILNRLFRLSADALAKLVMASKDNCTSSCLSWWLEFWCDILQICEKSCRDTTLHETVSSLVQALYPLRASKKPQSSKVENLFIFLRLSSYLWKWMLGCQYSDRDHDLACTKADCSLMQSPLSKLVRCQDVRDLFYAHRTLDYQRKREKRGQSRMQKLYWRRRMQQQSSGNMQSSKLPRSGPRERPSELLSSQLPVMVDWRCSFHHLHVRKQDLIVKPFSS